MCGGREKSLMSRKEGTNFVLWCNVNLPQKLHYQLATTPAYKVGSIPQKSILLNGYIITHGWINNSLLCKR